MKTKQKNKSEKTQQTSREWEIFTVILFFLLIIAFFPLVFFSLFEFTFVKMIFFGGR